MFGVFRHCVLSGSRAPVDQIQQWEKVNPDDIDKVPIQARDFQGRVIFGSEPPFPAIHVMTEKMPTPIIM